MERIEDEYDLTVQSVRTENPLKNLQGRSVRLDICATDREGKVYNIEVQRANAGAIAKRARYNSSLIDANITEPGEDMKKLPESYVIFITENDVRGGGRPIYRFERIDVETHELLEDQAHILYVNSQIQDNTPLGRLMRDFYCTSPKDMHYPQLAERTKYFKETEEGATIMCRAVEQLVESRRPEWEKRGEKKKAKSMVLAMLEGKEPYAKIAKYTDLSIEEIKRTDAERK